MPEGPGEIIAVAKRLSEAAATLRFGPPVSYVYHPLIYAWDAHAQYLRSHGGRAGIDALLVGMNPGPWGMAQTGVPFGEAGAVRDWLRIDASVGRPERVHPKRPVWGLDCPRSEVSGRRLWGWARDRFGEPGAFFEKFFVANYCPCMFLEQSGRNRTPDRLPVAEQKPLVEVCDRALRRIVQFTAPRWVVGIGRFAEQRARRALHGLPVQVGRILHPSPANPAANRGWREQAETQLAALGIEL